MTTTPRIFRNCALALPLVVVGAGAIGGSKMGAEVAAAGALAVMNFGLLAWFGSGFVHGIAVGNGGGIYGPLVVLKMTLSLPLSFALMTLISPLSVVVGACSVVLAVALTGVELGVLGDAESRPSGTEY